MTLNITAGELLSSLEKLPTLPESNEAAATLEQQHSQLRTTIEAASREHQPRSSEGDHREVLEEVYIPDQEALRLSKEIDILRSAILQAAETQGV